MNAEQIRTISKRKYLHQLAKLANKENHEAQLLITVNGGTFRITPELIAFLAVPDLPITIYLLDTYENPVELDRKEFLASCIERYNTVMQSWWDANEQINKQR